MAWARISKNEFVNQLFFENYFPFFLVISQRSVLSLWSRMNLIYFFLSAFLSGQPGTIP